MSTEEILQAWSRRLRSALSLAGLTPTEVALGFDVGAGTVRRWLANPGDMKARTYLDLCAAVDANAGELLTKAIEDARGIPDQARLDAISKATARVEARIQADLKP